MRTNQHDPAFWRALYDEHLSGAKVKDLAEKHQLLPGAVYLAFWKRDWPVRPDRKLPKTQEAWKALFDEFAAGASKQDLADRCHASTSSITKAFQKLGFTCGAKIMRPQRLRKQKLTDEERRAKRRAYYEENKEHELAAARKRMEMPGAKERRAEYMRLWRQVPGNKERARALNRRRLAQPNIAAAEKIRWRTEAARRRKEDPCFAIKCMLRGRLRAALKGIAKAAPTLELTGCSIDALKAYLESLFKPGMTWQNHGNRPGKWEIHHIKPFESFDLSDPAQQRAVNHYTNLLPLWYEEHKATHATTEEKV